MVEYDNGDKIIIPPLQAAGMASSMSNVRIPPLRLDKTRNDDKANATIEKKRPFGSESYSSRRGSVGSRLDESGFLPHNSFDFSRNRSMSSVNQHQHQELNILQMNSSQVYELGEPDMTRQSIVNDAISQNNNHVQNNNVHTSNSSSHVNSGNTNNQNASNISVDSSIFRREIDIVQKKHDKHNNEDHLNNHNNAGQLNSLLPAKHSLLLVSSGSIPSTPQRIRNSSNLSSAQGGLYRNGSSANLGAMGSANTPFRRMPRHVANATPNARNLSRAPSNALLLGSSNSGHSSVASNSSQTSVTNDALNSNANLTNMDLSYTDAVTSSKGHGLTVQLDSMSPRENKMNLDSPEKKAEEKKAEIIDNKSSRLVSAPNTGRTSTVFTFGDTTSKKNPTASNANQTSKKLFASPKPSPRNQHSNPFEASPSSSTTSSEAVLLKKPPNSEKQNQEATTPVKKMSKKDLYTQAVAHQHQLNPAESGVASPTVKADGSRNEKKLSADHDQRTLNAFSPSQPPLVSGANLNWELSPERYTSLKTSDYSDDHSSRFSPSVASRTTVTFDDAVSIAPSAFSMDIDAFDSMPPSKPYTELVEEHSLRLSTYPELPQLTRQQVLQMAIPHNLPLLDDDVFLESGFMHKDNNVGEIGYFLRPFTWPVLCIGVGLDGWVTCGQHIVVKTVVRPPLAPFLFLLPNHVQTYLFNLQHKYIPEDVYNMVIQKIQILQKSVKNFPDYMFTRYMQDLHRKTCNSLQFMQASLNADALRNYESEQAVLSTLHKRLYAWLKDSRVVPLGSLVHSDRVRRTENNKLSKYAIMQLKKHNEDVHSNSGRVYLKAKLQRTLELLEDPVHLSKQLTLEAYLKQLSELYQQNPQPVTACISYSNTSGNTPMPPQMQLPPTPHDLMMETSSQTTDSNTIPSLDSYAVCSMVSSGHNDQADQSHINQEQHPMQTRHNMSMDNVSSHSIAESNIDNHSLFDITRLVSIPSGPIVRELGEFQCQIGFAIHEALFLVSNTASQQQQQYRLDTIASSFTKRPYIRSVQEYCLQLPAQLGKLEQIQVQPSYNQLQYPHQRALFTRMIAIQAHIFYCLQTVRRMYAHLSNHHTSIYQQHNYDSYVSNLPSTSSVSSTSSTNSSASDNLNQVLVTIEHVYMKISKMLAARNQHLKEQNVSHVPLEYVTTPTKNNANVVQRASTTRGSTRKVESKKQAYSTPTTHTSNSAHHNANTNYKDTNKSVYSRTFSPNMQRRNTKQRAYRSELPVTNKTASPPIASHDHQQDESLHTHRSAQSSRPSSAGPGKPLYQWKKPPPPVDKPLPLPKPAVPKLSKLTASCNSKQNEDKTHGKTTTMLITVLNTQNGKQSGISTNSNIIDLTTLQALTQTTTTTMNASTPNNHNHNNPLLHNHGDHCKCSRCIFKAFISNVSKQSISQSSQNHLNLANSSKHDRAYPVFTKSLPSPLHLPRQVAGESKTATPGMAISSQDMLTQKNSQPSNFDYRK